MSIHLSRRVSADHAGPPSAAPAATPARAPFRARAADSIVAPAVALALILVALPALSSDSLPDVAPVRLETIATGLDHPWSIAVLPDGRELVTERAGRLRVIEEGALSPPIGGVPAVLAESQGGLFDIVPHPDFADNGWLYLSYAHGTSARNATRLARARLEGDSLVDLEVLFTASPWKGTPVHFGGRVAFLPDDTLLLTLGDGFDYREAAQRLDNHFGKIVRLHDDGRVPDDNPFVAMPDARPEIWSYGHRNPQGLAVVPAGLPDAGAVFSHEHGPAGGDEINRIEPGVNYGWPVATGGRDYSGAAISPFVDYPGTRAPLVNWTPSIAPAGLAIASGSSSPVPEGELLVATLKSRELLRVSRTGEDAGASAFEEAVLLDDRGRLRDVRVAPDGSLRVLTDAPDGVVLKVMSEP